MLDKCNLCGLCNSVCPIFRVTNLEINSPRGKAVLLKKKVKSDLLKLCTQCGACQVKCPQKVNLPQAIKRNI